MSEQNSNPPVRSTFAAFHEAMGFNAKQVGEAGELIGLSPAVARLRYHCKTSDGSEKDATETERLAMAARAAGLGPWTPDGHARLVEIGKLVQLADALPNRE